MKYISISGAVAAGKTTLLSRLMSCYGDRARARIERPEDNPFIREYYSDSARWSFHSQVTFLAMYFDDPGWQTSDREFYFYDRCLTENLVIAEYRRQAGDLTDDELSVLKKLGNGIASLMPPIDRYIYLKCSVPTLIAHTRSRNRDYESVINQGYFELQKRLYDEWAAQLPPEKVLTVDMDQEIDLDRIIRFIGK